MISHLNRSATALLAAVMMLSVLAGATLAAVPGPAAGDTVFAERGITAQGIWDSCEPPDASGVTRCEMTQAYVFDGRQRSRDQFGRTNGSLTYLCVYHQRAALGEDGIPVEPPIIEQGCTDGPQLSVVDPLKSLTASAPVLQLIETICTYDPETGEPSCVDGAARSVSVVAVFTGVGATTADRWSSKSRSIVDGARCTFSSSGSGNRREATASITIDGTTLAFGFGQLSDGKMRFAQHCR